MRDQQARRPEQEKSTQEKYINKSIDMDLYGAQGNQGQYGQGQYDSEGNPDPHGRQAQQIYPDDREEKSKKAEKTEETKQNSNQHFDVPLD